MLYVITLFALTASCQFPCEECQSERLILLTYDMIINENAVGKSIHLVDEQHRGETEQFSFRPTKIWHPDNTWNEPYYLTIDFHDIYSVDGIAFYHSAGLFSKSEGIISIYEGSPFNWELIEEDVPISKNEWQHIQLNSLTSQYLRIKIEGGRVNIGELFCFGNKVQDVPDSLVETLKQRPKKTTFDEMLGINTFIDDPIGRIDFFGFVREYHNWQWVELATSPPYPNNENSWNPADSNWDFD